MDKEELKKIMKEVLEEFLGRCREEWEDYLDRWIRMVRRGELPPPLLPYWYPPEIIRREVNELRRTVSNLQEISQTYREYLLRFESWAPQCSEKERIKRIEASVESMANYMKSLESSVKSIEESINEIRKTLKDRE